MTIIPENRFATWTLSHELMHFVIDYKDYGWKYQEEYVHKIDDVYDRYCIVYTIRECPNTYALIQTPSGKLMPVMKPMKDPRPTVEIQEQQITPEIVEPEKQTIPAPIDKENFDWRWVTTINFNVNGKKYIDLENGDIACYQVTTSVIGTLDHTLAYKKIRFTYTIPSNPDPINGYQLLDKYGNYRNCETWTADDLTVLIMTVFDGDDNFRASNSDIIRINLN